MDEIKKVIQKWMARSELWVTILGIISLPQIVVFFPEGTAMNLILQITKIIIVYILGRSGVKIVRALKGPPK